MTASTRIILLAHGSSDRRWCQTFEQLAAPTVESIDNAVVCYMELSEPSLDQVIASSVAEGFRDFRILPLFLAVGRHLRKDVPAMITDLEARHGVSIALLPPVGEDPKLGLAIRDVARGILESDQ